MYQHKKSALLDDLASRGAENLLVGMTLPKKHE